MWCPGEGGGRGRCVTSEEVRLDRPASELADCGRPHASRGAALLEQGGPFRGRGGGAGGTLIYICPHPDPQCSKNAFGPRSEQNGVNGTLHCGYGPN